MDIIVDDKSKGNAYYQNILDRLAEKDEIILRIKSGGELAIKELVKEGKISGNWDAKYIRLTIYSTYMGDKYPNIKAKYLYYIPAIHYHFQGNPDDIQPVLEYLTKYIKAGGFDKLYQKIKKAINDTPYLKNYSEETAYVVSCLFTDDAARLLNEYIVIDEIPQELQTMYDCIPSRKPTL